VPDAGPIVQTIFVLLLASFMTTPGRGYSVIHCREERLFLLDMNIHLPCEPQNITSSYNVAVDTLKLPDSRDGLLAVISTWLLPVRNNCLFNCLPQMPGTASHPGCRVFVGNVVLTTLSLVNYACFHMLGFFNPSG